MGKKFADLDQDDKRLLEEELASKSQQLGMNSFESYGINDRQNLLEDMVGLCASCKSLNYCRTEFGTVLAKCNEFEIRFSGQNRITECNLHAPRRMLTLDEMYSIAYLIDPSEEKIEGFITTNKRYTKKKRKAGIIPPS